MEFAAVLTRAEEGGYLALNPEMGTTTQGETVEEAIANLQEAMALGLAEFPRPSMGHPTGHNVYSASTCKCLSYRMSLAPRFRGCWRGSGFTRRRHVVMKR